MTKYKTKSSPESSLWVQVGSDYLAWNERNQKGPVPYINGIHPKPEVPPSRTTCGDSIFTSAEVHCCVGVEGSM